MSASTGSGSVRSDAIQAEAVGSQTSGSALEWAALDSQYERLIDPSDPAFADRPHHGHGHGHDRPRVTRWHPDRACA